MASEACKKNWVKINDQPIKASKEIRKGDIISVKIGPLQKVVRIEDLSQRRLSASLAQNLLSDLTTPEAYEKAKEVGKRLTLRITNKRGTGRPTKKQRRDLEDFLYPE
jgi:ribosome-associated heat shock protein Hsp15